MYLGTRLCIPKNGDLREKILEEHHESKPRDTQDALIPITLSVSFTIGRNCGAQCPSTSSVARFAKKTTTDRQKTPGLLILLPIPTLPWEVVTLDFANRLLNSKGHTAIMIVIDILTKMCHLIPTQDNATARDTAEVFLKNIFRLHGLPRTLTSDRDNKFTSEFWQQTFKLLGTKLTMSTDITLKPMDNQSGPLERLNKF